MSLLFYFVLRFLEERNIKLLYAAAVTSGLLVATSIMNALTIVFPVIFFLVVVEFCCNKERFGAAVWIKAALGVLSGFVFYLYYPIALALGPGFIHPMNLMVDKPLGSLSWFAWFVSGRAWTGEGMFSLGRAFLNTPNYFRHAVESFTMIGIAAFVVALAIAFKKMFDYCLLAIKGKESFKKAVYEAPIEIKALFLLLFSYLLVALPQLSLSDVSNPGSTTYIYVANFFLPSFLILAMLIGVGLGYILDLIEESSLLERAFKMFADEGELSPQNKRTIVLISLYCLFILPMYLLAVNFKFCDLKGEDTGYRFAYGTIQSLPEGSVVYSKLVYELVGTYFAKIEPSLLGQKNILIENPDIITLNEMRNKPLTANPMVEKTIILKKTIADHLARQEKIYIAGDCVDQDKAPEPLLLSDLDLSPSVPQALLLSLARPFPTELIPYEVKGMRSSSVFLGSPEVESRGVANDGNFSGLLEVIGYTMSKEMPMPVGRNKISLDLYWRTLSEVKTDLVGVFALFNDRLQRIDPVMTSGFFTLGGENPTSKWKKGQIIKERADYYLPALPFGQYYLALGIVGEDGLSVQYVPANPDKYAGKFDFVLLLPFGFGPQAPLSGAPGLNR
jgi:hypothetical protein